MISKFGEDVSIQPDELRELVFQVLESVDATPSSRLKKVLLLPPDHTRLNSMAGPITAMAYEKLVAQGVSGASRG